ncbi:hypothetical protein JN531_001460 [Flagellatimonas centrodinii]|uniref:hypothetical protein n=1 Tax=Flagellatimonas centrodinii TaxID=2806210 RepID=UPI001FEF658B|nr:hypothetical protein [Flagellatimonas centrodinii]ULQ46966.1 hypothetical protein JN531_001460 [Flagellatimonas centrodinii]
MARLPFTTVESWMQRENLKAVEAARRFGVSSQVFNGWRKRGRVSADKSDAVRAAIRAAGTQYPPYSSEARRSEPPPADWVRRRGRKQEELVTIAQNFAATLPDDVADAIKNMILVSAAAALRAAEIAPDEERK